MKMGIDSVNVMTRVKRQSDGFTLFSLPTHVVDPIVANKLRNGRWDYIHSPRHPKKVTRVKLKGSSLLIVGSPCNWFHGQNNACGDEWTSLIDRWVQEVVDYLFGAGCCEPFAVRLTQLDIFSMIDCGSPEGVQATIYFLAICCYTIQRPLRLFEGRTCVSAYLGRKTTRNVLVRAYSKYMENVDKRTTGWRTLERRSPTLSHCMRLEISFRLFHTRKGTGFSADRWRQLDLQAHYYKYLRQLKVANPYDQQARNGVLSEVDEQRLQRWKEGAVDRSNRRDARNARNHIRSVKQFDLRRKFTDYSKFDPACDHLTLEQILDPSRDRNEQIWRELRRSR